MIVATVPPRAQRRIIQESQANQEQVLLIGHAKESPIPFAVMIVTYSGWFEADNPIAKRQPLRS